MKPLFIPLKKEYFEQFEAGTKKKEFRLYGPRWNEKTCIPGREVILSFGYGKQRRLQGTIKSFSKVPVMKSEGMADFWLIYGVHAGPVAEIEIENINPLTH